MLTGGESLEGVAVNGDRVDAPIVEGHLGLLVPEEENLYVERDVKEENADLDYSTLSMPTQF